MFQWELGNDGRKWRVWYATKSRGSLKPETDKDETHALWIIHYTGVFSGQVLCKSEYWYGPSQQVRNVGAQLKRMDIDLGNYCEWPCPLQLLLLTIKFTLNWIISVVNRTVNITTRIKHYCTSRTNYLADQYQPVVLC